MKVYTLTAYEPSGEVLLDESIKAENDAIAKEKGQAILDKKQCHEKTHRLVSPTGKLLLFHS